MATLVDEIVDGGPVTRSAAAWDEKDSGNHPVGEIHSETGVPQGNDATEEDVTTADEKLSPEMLSLEFALRTCCFEGFEGKRMTFLYTTQLTCSNVMSTVVTARPLDTSAKRKLNKHNGIGVSNQHESSTSTTTTTTTTATMHVYAQPSNRKKVKKKNGKYQAQLPSFHRSLPALPIPINRLNRELILERDTFMQQLHRERDDKKRLDTWAATKIQACYRGFRARPRLLSYEMRQRLNTVSSLRGDLSDMEYTLKQSPATVDDAVAVASPWRKDIQSRAGQKREFRATKERKQYASTMIQATVRGFVARCAYARRYARHMDEVLYTAIVRIQCMFRAFRLRARIASVVAKLQQAAALQIQRLIRGILARERVLTLTFEHKCDQRRRAGQPLQFTLPQRTPAILRVSCLRVLFAHRKTPQQLAFRSPAWHEDRQLLHIYKVATKLHVQRQWLLRLTVVTPTTTRRKKRGVSAAMGRQSSRLTSRLSVTNNSVPPTSSALVLASATNGRRPPLSPNSRPASPINTVMQVG